MSTTTTLVKYDEACRLLGEAAHIDEVREIHNKAIALQVCAMQAQNGELIANAAAIRGDETGMTADPRKEGIPVLLQTQNR